MPNPIRLGLALAALCLVSCPTLVAAEGEEAGELHYGGQILVSRPTQDFGSTNLGTGLGGGLFVENALDNGVVVQTRIDFIRYPQTNSPNLTNLAALTGPSALALSGDSADIGVDVHKYLPFKGLKRFYLLGGLMGTRYEFQTTTVITQPGPNGTPVTALERQKAKTSFKLCLAVGAGFDLGKNLGVVARYTTMDIDGITFATLETGLSLRF